MTRLQLLTAGLLSTTLLFAGEAEDRRLREADTVLREIMTTKDQAIPQDLLAKADCAVIIPGLKKAGFIGGVKYGRGFAVCRKPSGVGWTAPAGMRIEGGSVGFQIGGAESDIILLVMNKKGMDRLTSSKFTLGGEAAVAAGPVGRDTQAQTDITMRAEILSWSRSRGVFGGVALQGATLRPDTEADAALYGAGVSTKDILEDKAKTPKTAAALLATLNKYSSRHGR